MLELFKELKVKYQDYLLLFKSGSFYISFDSDALVLNQLFGYKILILKNNIKVGFPVRLIDKNTTIISQRKINYMIIDQKKIIDKNKYKFNNYTKYGSNICDMIHIITRINNISQRLKDITIPII